MASQTNDNGHYTESNSDRTSRPIDIEADALDITAPIKERIGEAIAEQKSAGADKLEQFGQAITQAAEGFKEQMPQAAGYIRDAGRWIDRSASDLREQKFEALFENLGNFAEKNPGMAFGVAILSGFALSRFLKSSRPASSSPVNPSYEPAEQLP